MSNYRRNSFRRETINRFGQTAGLPLFESSGGPQIKQIPEPTRTRFDNAPLSVAVANDTKKLAHLLLTFDKIGLAEKQQKVLDVLIGHTDLTNEEIAYLLGWPINRVVGRTFDLRHLGIEGQPFVLPAFKRKCSITGNVVQAWKFNDKIPVKGKVEAIKENKEEQ